VRGAAASTLGLQLVRRYDSWCWIDSLVRGLRSQKWKRSCSY
jgi:hypothetical protein